MTTNEKILEARNALLNKDFAAAESLYNAILAEDAGNLCALDGLGIIATQNNEISKGIQYFNEALYKLRTSNTKNERWEATVLFHIGLAYRSLGYKNESLKVLSEAVKLAPEEPDLLLNLGQIHFELEQFAEAIGYFRSLTFVQPDNASAWLTLGFILYQRKQYHEAIAALKTAELLDETSPEICLYLAEAHRKNGLFQESLPYYQKLLAVGSAYPEAVYGYGQALLATNNFADGWDAMEFRMTANFGTWNTHQLPTIVPDCRLNSVLAYSEGNIADDIMFASCLPDLVNNSEHCVIECDSSLHNLFKRSFPRAEVVPPSPGIVGVKHHPWGKELNAQVALGSLPRYFRRDKFDFPLRKAYLVPDKQRAAYWSNKLAESGDAKKIGIVWHGNWTAETEQQTALPVHEVRSMIAQRMNALWINLQNGSQQNQLGSRNGLNPKTYAEVFHYDLDEMAAMLTALDLVVTPPGYVAHLAGALGVKTWVVLPAGVDWRWNISQEQDRDRSGISRCIWHNSLSLYRQAPEQSWTEVFATLGKDIDTFLEHHRSPENMPQDTILRFPAKEPGMQDNGTSQERRKAA